MQGFWKNLPTIKLELYDLGIFLLFIPLRFLKFSLFLSAYVDIFVALDRIVYIFVTFLSGFSYVDKDCQPYKM